MKIINTDNPNEGIKALASKITSNLNKGKVVLWLIPGGSNIPISVEVMNKIRLSVAPGSLQNLIVALTDERYGSIGHADSNWRQLLDAHLMTDKIKTIPVLEGLPISDTVTRYGSNIEKAIKSAQIIVGQFGVGSDGHIAGILPHSKAVIESRPVCAHESAPYVRVTLTPHMLRKIDAAYVFVFGLSKKDAIDRLRDEAPSLDEQPVQILRQMSEAFVYTDQ